MLGRTSLRPGEFHWSPERAGRRRRHAITVDIANQVAFVFKGSQLIGVTNASTGRVTPTPLGFWTINWKKPKYFSRNIDNAPMPWIQNIDDKGIALHGGNTPAMPQAMAASAPADGLCEAAHTLTKTGNKVVIEG